MTAAAIKIENSKIVVQGVFKTKSEAQGQGNAYDIVEGPEDFGPGYTSVAITELHNRLADKPVKKFKNRKAVTERVWTLIARMENAEPETEEKPAPVAKKPAATKAGAKAYRREPCDTVYPCREGTKQAAVVDAFVELEPTTIEDIVEWLIANTVFTNASKAQVSATISYDLCTVKGYGYKKDEQGRYSLLTPGDSGIPAHTPKKGK